ncbi:MAG: Maf-like protein [Parvularculaceae bacterium]|nr:Maf-like protein [Parvularculaceae bacterium]
MEIILASGSASRRAILTGAGVPFTVVRPQLDEDALKPTFAGLTPANLALELARAKALSIQEPDAVVIGSDQVMEFDGRPFDKPKSREELKQRLLDMADKPHHLRGGVIMVRDGKVLAEIKETSTLSMRPLREKDIDAYLAVISDDIALGTVGGYALEAEGARLFSKIEGDYFSILGLPLLPVLDVLRREGALQW